LFKGNPFEQIKVTAHVDTGKEEDADLLKQLVDPERYYPVYGDSAEEVQDVASREKVYVLVEADESRRDRGKLPHRESTASSCSGSPRYFGASLDLDHDFAKGFGTEVHACRKTVRAG